MNSRSRSRGRGVGALVGGTIVLLILVAFIATFVYIQRQQIGFVNEVMESINRRSKAATFKLEVTSVELTDDGGLNLTVENGGDLPVEVNFIGVFNAETGVGRYYNATWIGSTESGVIINPHSTETNVTTLEPLAQDVSSGTWIVQLLCEEGYTTSATYPMPAVVAWEWSDLPYSPVPLSEGSVASLANATMAVTVYPSSVTVTVGSHIGGGLYSLRADDNDYYVVSSEPMANETEAYHPSSYNVKKGSLVSGGVTELESNDGEYMVVRAEASNQVKTAYAHQETVIVAGEEYMMYKTAAADGPETVLSVDSSSRGLKLVGRFVFPLSGIGEIPKGTLEIYYRGYFTITPLGRAPEAYFYSKVYVLHEDGSKTHIGDTNSVKVRSSPRTLKSELKIDGRVPVSDTDYLEVDVYVDVREPGRDSQVHLIVDDPDLPTNKQTRIRFSKDLFPTRYGLEVEFTGTSNLYDWNKLVWRIDSAYTVGGVVVTLQLYDYGAGSYPTSGDGYMSYTSSSTPDTDELMFQGITVNPTRFRDPATGEWKVKITATRDTVFNEAFDGKFDLVEYETEYPVNHAAEVEYHFEDVYVSGPSDLMIALVLNHSAAPISINLSLYNFESPSWDVVNSTTYQITDEEVTYEVTIPLGSEQYVSGGRAKLRVKSLLSGPSSGFVQRTDLVTLKVGEEQMIYPAIYIGVGGADYFYSYLQPLGIWVQKSPPPFTWTRGSSMVYVPNELSILATNATHLFKYDIPSDTWSYLTALPQPAGSGSFLAHSSAYPDVIIYAPGGGSSSIYSYDLSTSSWTSLPAVPEPIGSYGAASGDDRGRIYVAVGGGSVGFYVYDMGSSSWSRLEDLPSPKVTGLVYCGDKVYLSEVDGGIHVYDVASGEWTPLIPRIPSYSEAEGNRLLCDGTRLYYAAFDGSREIFVIEIASLSSASG